MYYVTEPEKEIGRYKDALRRIANNEILSEETKEAIRFAVYRIDDIVWYKREISDLKEQIEHMKARNNNESV